MGFRSKQNPATKTWDIFDIPVLPEVKHGEHDLNEKWMQGAISRAALRKSEGYRYRLHQNHHKTDKRATPAGFFTPTQVRDHVYEGEPRRTLFVNYEDVPDGVYQEMRKGNLPHRSLECLDVSRDIPEIDSLSLLDTETPKFRFEVTTGENLLEEPLAASEDSGGQTPTLVAESGPVRLWQSGNKIAVLSKEPTMKGSLQFSEDGKFVVIGEDGAEIKEGLTFSVNGTECEITSIVLPAVEDKDILAAQAEIAELKTKLAEKTPVVAPVMDVAHFGELRGRLDRLEAKDAKTELIAAATKDLKGQGFAIGEDLEKDLALYAAEGEEPLKRFTESYAKFAAPEPPAFNGVVTMTGPQDSVAVAKFVAATPERADTIREASMEWTQLKESMPALKCSEEQFIADRTGV